MPLDVEGWLRANSAVAYYPAIETYPSRDEIRRLTAGAIGLDRVSVSDQRRKEPPPDSSGKRL